MSDPDRPTSLAALEAAERAGDAEAAAGWQRYLASIARPIAPGAPRLPPPPTLYSAPNFCVRICNKPHKKHLLEALDPAAGRLFCMLPHRMLTAVRAGPGWLELSGAIHRAEPSGVARLELPGVDTAGVAAGLRKRLKLPRVPLPVDVQELTDHAERYDGLLVDVTGTWSHGFENSSFAQLWLGGPKVPGFDGRTAARATVRVVGFVFIGRAGHLGVSRGAIDAVSITPLI